MFCFSKNLDTLLLRLSHAELMEFPYYKDEMFLCIWNPFWCFSGLYVIGSAQFQSMPPPVYFHGSICIFRSSLQEQLGNGLSIPSSQIGLILGRMFLRVLQHQALQSLYATHGFFLSVSILFLCCLVWKAPISSQAEVGLIHSKLKNSICFHEQIFKLFYYFLCFTACLYVYMCTMCLTGTCWSQERGHSIPWD